MKIKDLAIEVHAIALSKGWWKDRPENIVSDLQAVFDASKLALVHSEVSEAIEALRSGMYETDVIDGKPEGVAIELADTIIRILDFCEYHRMDIEKAIRMKIEYNRNRPIKHGGKLF